MADIEVNLYQLLGEKDAALSLARVQLKQYEDRIKGLEAELAKLKGEKVEDTSKGNSKGNKGRS